MALVISRVKGWYRLLLSLRLVVRDLISHWHIFPELLLAVCGTIIRCGMSIAAFADSVVSRQPATGGSTRGCIGSRALYDPWLVTHASTYESIGRDKGTISGSRL